MTQNQKMRDFVKSLENNQFSKEQGYAACRKGRHSTGWKQRQV